MRPVVLSVLPLALAVGAGAAAAEPAPSSPRVTLVKILPEARQALLHDRDRDEYVVVRRGQTIQSFYVSSIGLEEIVLTSAAAPTTHYVLAPAPSAPPARARGPEVIDPYAPRPAAAAPSRPGVPAIGASPAPAAEPGVGGPITVHPGHAAPPAPRPDAQGPAQAPEAAPTHATQPAVPPPPAAAAPAAPPTHAPDAHAAPTPTHVPAPAPAPPHSTPRPAAPGPAPAARPPAAGPEPIVASPQGLQTISRRELDAALSDFYALSRDVQLERTGDGGLRIAALVRGSFLERHGLRAGDVIRRVAGHPIDTAERAATVYVALTAAERFDVQLEREGAPLSLRFSVK